MNARRPRAQIALWMLTKFGMIFFILGLMVVLIGFSTNTKNSLCQGQAHAVTAAVHSSIVNVLSSPVEDERAVIPLERTLSLGGNQFERYSINLTSYFRQGEEDPEDDLNSILIDVMPENSRSCKSSSNVVYSTNDKKISLTLLGNKEQSSEGEVLKLNPSGQENPSTYLILIKCQEKCYPSERSLFVIACNEPYPDSCINFNDPQLTPACGWKECPAE